MPHRDWAWTSDGLGPSEAVEGWPDVFVRRQETPIEVEVYEAERFDAFLISRGIGQLRMLHMRAPAQKVVHPEVDPEPDPGDHLVHLIYAIEGSFTGRDHQRNFTVEAGEFALLDNSHFFELDCTAHEAIDLIVPLRWLEQHVPDPLTLLSQPMSMRDGWAPPLGTLLETIARQGENCPMPLPLVAEQLGNLIAFAVGVREPTASRTSARLAQQIMRRIEGDCADPELSPEMVASELGISKRYLQSLLANSGTSFVRELNAVRLDKANILLTDPRTRDLPVAEIAFRCGFLDPGYFGRQFRKRFNATPRGWRSMN
ncbi:MAG: AraC family transcriptional regulator [Candidatus Andeanibacterium colombiense]|uniref:AraC family transcriptional regulator n=1 Tax=Candidatus Andeanibacterium colombiense TaxID=3121345 RepID=A0AAJ5X8R2_9SPHN|nr:MAG: AraC family transcriptional regulator [Sphingomonadaceae bacterium]